MPTRGGRCVIDVYDNETGLSCELHDRINFFSPRTDQRADAANDLSAFRFLAGMPICLGMKIEVASRLDTIATSIVLPFAGVDRRAPARVRRAQGNVQGLNIVLDDDPLIVAATSTIVTISYLVTNDARMPTCV